MAVVLILRVLALAAAADAFTFHPIRFPVASLRHNGPASCATTMLQAHSSDETRRELLQKTASAFVAIAATYVGSEVALAADSMSPEAARAQWNAAMQKLNEIDEKYEAVAAVSELQRKCTNCSFFCECRV